MTLELTFASRPFAATAVPDVPDHEILDGPQFAGLTRAERKALAITSTFETGHAGGFF